jgi:hypothetical protein
MSSFRTATVLALAFAVVCFVVVPSFAQTTTTTTGTTTTGTTTTGTTSTSNVTGAAGVVVDASGVLRSEYFQDKTGQLAKQRMAAARAALAAKDAKIAAASPLRKISLNRLEAAVKAQLESGLKPTDEMKHLAGLTRVQYVFYYPETKDIVIAGPAEPWMADLSGRVRGLSTGRPVVELDDLVTALRAYAPGAKPTTQISCSIDPTQEGLQRMQDVLKDARANAGPGDMPQVYTAMKQALGPQNISIRGINAATHFAQVLVEADYRMKLIGIGLERPPVRGFQVWIDRVNSAAVAKNALQRWYFMPDYECVKVSHDDLAMELLGQGVKLVNEDELVARDGTRIKSASVNSAAKAWTDAFTAKYTEIANAVPVYAQLRNCIDLAVAAAFIQQKDYYRKAGWTMPLFGEEATYPVQTLTAPTQVDNITNYVSRGNTVMMPIGGGVQILANRALDSKNVQPDDDGKVSEAHDKIDIKNLAADKWWWD